MRSEREIRERLKDIYNYSKFSSVTDIASTELEWVLSGDDTFRADVRELVRAMDFLDCSSACTVLSDLLNKVRRHFACGEGK